MFCSFLKGFNLFLPLNIQRGSGMPSEALFLITLLILLLTFCCFLLLVSGEWTLQQKAHKAQMIYSDDCVLIHLGMGVKEENWIETTY